MQRHLSTGSTILATLMAVHRHPASATDAAPRVTAAEVSRLLSAMGNQERRAERPGRAGAERPDCQTR